MRVISGIYRGRKIASPLNNAIRPTTDKVKEAIFSIVQSEIRGATVIDLFSGTGALAIEAISRGAEKVYMCDNTPASLDLIKQNLSFVKRESYDLYKGDYVDCIRRFVSKGEKADVIILDPPRKGCDEATLTACAEMSPERIVMISCNAATAARDCKWMQEHGYKAEKARAFDLFPRTTHVECVVMLVRC